jgi:hypothetical protein
MTVQELINRLNDLPEKAKSMPVELLVWNAPSQEPTPIAHLKYITPCSVKVEYSIKTGWEIVVISEEY